MDKRNDFPPPEPEGSDTDNPSYVRPPDAENESTETPVSIAKKLGIYYDSERTSFWVQNNRDGWIRVTNEDVQRRFKKQGFGKGKDSVSQIDALLIAIQEENDVDFAGSLAGYHSGVYMLNEKRVLVRDSPNLIQRTEGKWEKLHGILLKMLGQNQLFYLYGWLKVAVEALYAKSWRPGQALVLAGPKDCGKSLLQNLITLLLGGRSASPYRYMTNVTQFNGDLIGCEHLMIEDQIPSTDIRARRNFGAKIKEICANENQSAHPKYRSALTLPPLWRLSISVNDEPEYLLILPPIDDSLLDKLIILKAEKHSMPMRTVSIPERKAFMSVLRAELPHFLDFLFRWEIPEDLKSHRYGITHFQHPEILKAVGDLAPEAKLLALIDNGLFSSTPPEIEWEGSAEQLEHKLKDGNSVASRDAEKLLTWPHACGTYLGRLQKRYPKRFEVVHYTKGNVWTIKSPESE